MENQNPESPVPQEPASQAAPSDLPSTEPVAPSPTADLSAQTPPPTTTPQPAPAGGITEQQWILFLNLSALAGFVVPSMGHILGPLIIWLVKKAESPAIDAAGRAVLNFQISWTIWMIASVVLAFVGSCLVVPMFLPVAVGIAWLVFVIIGSMKASSGEPYRTIKML